MKILWILVFFASCASAQDFLDVETLSTLRTRQYPLNPFQKVVVFSAPRTGSSLVYNVFRYLFENENYLLFPHNQFDLNRFVLKTHNFGESSLLIGSNVLFIVTLRNPIQAAISYVRICPRKTDNLQNFLERLMRKHAEYVTFCEALQESGLSLIHI